MESTSPAHPQQERNELRTVVFFKPEPKPAKGGGAKAPKVARAEIVFETDKAGGDAEFCWWYGKRW